MICQIMMASKESHFPGNQNPVEVARHAQTASPDLDLEDRTENLVLCDQYKATVSRPHALVSK